MNKKIHAILIISLLFISACAYLKKSGYSVTGKVARNKKPLSNIDVYAYKNKDMLDFSKPDYSTKTDIKGEYNFNFDNEGYYYIAAQTIEKTGKIDLYGFYGRNPVFVTKTGLSNINLNLQKIKGEVSFDKLSQESEQTGIKCTLTHNEEPLAGATVYAAVDLNEGMQTKGFAQSDTSDENGECFIALEKGTYYLTARKRSNEMFGHLSEGDLIGFYHKNPIVIAEDGTYTVNIELVEIPKKNVDINAADPSKTVVTGVVQNEDGKAVSGIWVCAYKEQQMFGKPLAISQEKTNANGEYVIALPKGDKYYLAARNTLGAPPAPGELYGQYDATDDHSITIETGSTITGINIVVKEMW